MPTIRQWDEIKNTYYKGSLLLGNGASIAVNECFNYSSLYDKAVDLGHLTHEVKEVFEKFNVEDFELVLRRLWQARLVNEALKLPPGKVDNAYKEVRQALISTVRDTHVSYDEAKEHLRDIYKFMKEFKFIISLNYDLIVYWAMLVGNDQLGKWFKDGFTPSKFKRDWQTLKKPYESQGATLCFYPHGNLVLCREGYSSERKIRASQDSDLLESILEKWEQDNLVPAFVCEGTKENKRESISSCDYFERVFYEVLPSLGETLVVYGWGFGKQDEHIIEQIAKSGVRKVAVGVYGKDQALCGHIEHTLKPLNLSALVFFDSESEGCWNNPIKENKKSEAVI